jgi:integrase
MASFRFRPGLGKERRWNWRVRLKGYPEQSGTCSTKECAKACASQAELRLKGGHTSTRTTLTEVIDRYLEEYLPQIPDSASLYRRHLAWWRKELGHHFVSAITPQMVSAKKAELAARPSTSGVLKRRRRAGGEAGGGAGVPDGDPSRKEPAERQLVRPATVNRYLVSLSSVFTWAMQPEIGLVERNVVRDVARLKEPPGRVRWLSRPVDEEDSELERLLKACLSSESTFLFDIVVLLLSTGCRENEIVRLRRRDIRLAEGGFTIPAKAAKNEEPRFVALSGLGLEVVSRRLRDTAGSEDAYLFPRLVPGRGKKRDGETEDEPATFPWTAWRTVLERAGLKDLRPHDLRHTHGSYLGMMGKTLPEIMRALGHKTPAVALRYIHLSDAHHRKVSADVNAEIVGWVGSVLQPAVSAE